MSVRFVPLCLSAVCLMLFPCGAVHARTLGILSPDSALPKQIAPGDEIEVEVAIPVALTPPPGVQKASVWKNWHVYLARHADLVTGGASRRLVYEMRLLRIRPGRQNVNYIMAVESLHWLPSGAYDLIVKGPGLRYVSSDAVNVSGHDSGRSQCTCDIIRVEDAHWQLKSTKNSKGDCWLDVVVSRDVGSVVMFVDNQRAPLSRVVWASHYMHGESDGRRLLRIRIPAVKEAVDLRIKPRKTQTRQVSIQGGESVRPMVWTKLRVHTSFKPVQVIWEFVDGDNRTGSEVQYRWMVGTAAVAEVAAFDEYGKPWTAALNASLTMPLSRTANSSLHCALIPGAPSRRMGIFQLFQFCIESFFNLME